MTLVDYITKVGDQIAATQFGVKPRTTASWRRRERLPRPDQAERIVAESPVTYEGIYGADQTSLGAIKAN